MKGNPFYVQPMGDYSQHLSGLGQMIGDIGREKKTQARFQEVQGAMQQAWESQDPNKMAEVAIKYPEARESVELMFGFYEDAQGRNPTKPVVVDTYRRALADPQNAAEYLTQGINQVSKLGGEPMNMITDLGMFRRDPESAVKNIEMGFSAIDPEGYKAYQKQKAGGTESSKLGTYNPRDYTTESWSRFLKTGDAGTLERYESQNVVDVGGTKYLVDRVTGARTQISTPEEAGKSKATIESAVTKAKEDAKAAAAKQVTEATAGASLNDASSAYRSLSDSDLDLIYGKGEAWFPEFFRSQKGIDLIAQRDKLVGMLNLAARGQLKGQGTITDQEAETLNRAVSALSNPNISPELARQELDSAIDILRRNAGVQKAETAVSQDEQALQWARQNPNDPRAAAILQKLGVR